MQIVISTNRTIVELKLDAYGVASVSTASTNRTIVELKLNLH